MSGGLSIRLKPHEKVLINGAIIENGSRRTKICVRSPNVKILRFSDALHPSEATTPAKSVYYKAQLVVIGEVTTQDAAQEVLPALRALNEAFPGNDCGQIIDNAITAASNDDYYKVMKLMKSLFPLEENLLMVARVKKLDSFDRSSNTLCSSRQQA